MSAIADIFTGGGDIQDTANQAAANIGFNPFNIQGGALGGVSFDQETGGISLQAGQLEQQFGGQFSQLAQQLIGGAGQGGPFGPLSGALGQVQGQLGGIGQQQLQGAQQFAGAGQQALQALGQFDPDAFASQQFQRLNRLAAPGETTQARQAAQNLFGRGQLGRESTQTGEVFRNLDLSQSLARDARLGQALGLAGTEQQRLGQQAGLFGQLGQQGFQQAGGTFLNRFGAAGQALAGGQQFQQGQIGQGLGLLQSLQGFQQQPFQLLGPSLAAAAGQSTAAQAAGQLQVQGATEAANARGGFFSGLAGALSPVNIPGLS